MSDIRLVAASDEARHTPSADREWAESFYLNFSDRGGTLGGFVRIGLYPARGQSDAVVCVYLPGGGVALTSWTEAMPAGERSIRSGALAMECIEPLRTWRVTYSGELRRFADPAAIPGAVARGEFGPPVDVQLSLEIDGLHPPVFYPKYARAAAPPPHRTEQVGLRRRLRRALRRPREIGLALRMRSGAHYEQSMRVRGEVTIAGARFACDGGGHRDHSWGPRDWGTLQHMRWLTGQMDGLAFNAVYITLAGSSVTNGYVWLEGESRPVDRLLLENTFDASGRAGREVCLTLGAGGRELTIRGDVLVNVPLPIAGDGTSTLYTVGWTKYRCGDRTGYGVAEFLERLDP
jgi:hypothetical protein